MHKTPKASSYYCLMLDFSGIDSSSSDRALASLGLALFRGIFEFSKYHPDKGFSYEQMVEAPREDPESLLSLFFNFFNNFQYRAKENEWIYVIIDEYDHFSNEVLDRDKKAFKNKSSTVSGNQGLLKRFFSTLKSYIWSKQGAAYRALFHHRRFRRLHGFADFGIQYRNQDQRQKRVQLDGRLYG